MARTFGDYVRDFFRNWKESDAPLGEKIRLTMANRARSVARGGCCGHRGEPGC